MDRLCLCGWLVLLLAGCGGGKPAPDKEAKALAAARDYIEAWGQAKESRNKATQAGHPPKAQLEPPTTLLDYWLLQENINRYGGQDLVKAERLLGESAPKFKAPEPELLLKAQVRMTEATFGVGGTWERIQTPFGGSELYYTFLAYDREGKKTKAHAMCGITFMTNGVIMAVPAWEISHDEYQRRIANWNESGRGVDKGWKP